MTTPNWSNRTLWTGDNLDIMRGMNSETVDLIYLDPPFNSNQDYAAPVEVRLLERPSRTLGRLATWMKHGTERSPTETRKSTP